MNRRRAIAILGGAGATALLPHSEAATVSCIPTTPQVTEGPYWVDEKLFRSDIRTDPSTGVARLGVPLTLNITVVNGTSSCTPLAGAWVDVWHCDAIGIYSDEPAYNPGGGTGTVVTSGQKFLRGYQITDDNGSVQFTTIYPGWYSGRTIHIHVRVRTFNGTTMLGEFTSQVFFDDATSNQVMALAPYSNRTSKRDTTNTNDMVYEGAQNPSRMLSTLTGDTTNGFTSNISLGVSMQAPAAAAPALASGGVINAASGATGLAPGAWISIFGSNLAAATRTLASSDIINNLLPTSLGGVSAQINGKAAYPDYVSPSQVNVLAPADSLAGSVSVSVTNSAGTSAAVTAQLQPVLPGLFTASSYIAGVTTASAGDIIELYGTGFGPAAASPDPGTLFTGAYATTNPVTVTIGGIAAQVQWAGLIGPGLYQINVTVPSGLTSGDNTVTASVAGSTTQSAKIKIA